MELVQINQSPIVKEVETTSSDQFMEANTETVNFNKLDKKCIIPVFAKDNEPTISHSSFITTVQDAAREWLNAEKILEPAIRVSHPIKGRIPEAVDKPVALLKESEKTLYYERMAFIIDIPTIYDEVAGNKLTLSIGGVRAYNHDNLRSRKTEEKFKIFIGFKNMVCINLCISTDGLQEEIRVRTIDELKEKAFQMVAGFNAHEEIKKFKALPGRSITEKQFAQMVGRARMYPHIPKNQKGGVPEFPLSDSQITTVVKDYYSNESFCRDKQGNINLWRLYNLFTSANKSSYIDNFLQREAGAFRFIQSILESVRNDRKHWYLIGN
ncbi:MAG: DUF3871 family protein [Spirochaetaceae bacterium]|nr:DUF3871 family protein [Spirochaetaceae bacterium]